MVRAFIGGMMVAFVAPLIGTFLVIRRSSYMADTLAHVSLVGVSGALLMNFSPFLGALIATLLASLGIEKLRHYHGLFGESLLALFLSGSLAISAVLISLANGFNSDLFSFLFGSITTISREEVMIITGLAIIVTGCIIWNYHRFFLISFDEDLAHVEGIPVKRYNIILMSLAAIAVAISIQIVGALLIGALMVIPTLTAFLWRKSFRCTLIIALFVSLFSTATGLYGSYYLDIASGGAIVIIALGCFIASIMMKGNRN